MMRVEDFAVGVVGLIGNPMAYNEALNVEMKPHRLMKYWNTF